MSITTCPVCGAEAHPHETNDNGECWRCWPVSATLEGDDSGDSFATTGGELLDDAIDAGIDFTDADELREALFSLFTDPDPGRRVEWGPYMLAIRSEVAS